MKRENHLEETRDGAEEQATDAEEGHEAAGEDDLLDPRLQLRPVPRAGLLHRAEQRPAAAVLRVHRSRRRRRR